MLEDILNVFKEHGNVEAINKSIDPYNVNILDAGFVDSFSITSIIALIEEYYEYSFSSRQLQGDEIRSIDGIVNILTREINKRE